MVTEILIFVEIVLGTRKPAGQVLWCCRSGAVILLFLWKDSALLCCTRWMKHCHLILCSLLEVLRNVMLHEILLIRGWTIEQCKNSPDVAKHLYVVSVTAGQWEQCESEVERCRNWSVSFQYLNFLCVSGSVLNSFMTCTRILLQLTLNFSSVSPAVCKHYLSPKSQSSSEFCFQLWPVGWCWEA